MMRTNGNDQKQFPHEYLAEKQVSPFLGEVLSVHEGLHQQVLALEAGKLTVDGMGILRMSRAQSLEGLSSILSDSPVLIKLPKSRSSTELGDVFEAIPKNSWMFPYIIACAPPILLQGLTTLPKLIDVSSQRRQTSHSNSAAFNSTSGLMSSNAQKFGFSDTRLSSLDQHPSALANETRTKSATPPPPPPVPPPNIAFPSSWRSLGVLLVTQDPSWRPWEKKQLFLLDNFLVETSVDGSKLLGYAPLAAASIKKCPFTDPHGRARCYSGSGNSTNTNNNSLNNSHIRSPINTMATSPFAIRKEDLAYGLVVSCYTRSDRASPLYSFWITCRELQDLDIIQNALLRASHLKVEDVFDLPDRFPSATSLSNPSSSHHHTAAATTADGKPGSTILGRGRFNEVRLGRRKKYRIVDRRILEKMTSPSSSMTHSTIANHLSSTNLTSSLLTQASLHNNHSANNATSRSRTQSTSSVSSATATASARMLAGSLTSPPMLYQQQLHQHQQQYHHSGINNMNREDSNSSLYQLQYYDDETNTSGTAQSRSTSKVNLVGMHVVVQQTQSMDASQYAAIATGLNIDDDYFLDASTVTVSNGAGFARSGPPLHSQPTRASSSAHHQHHQQHTPQHQQQQHTSISHDSPHHDSTEALMFGDLDISSHDGGSVVGQRSGDNLADLAASMSLYEPTSTANNNSSGTNASYRIATAATAATSVTPTPRKLRLPNVGDDDANAGSPIPPSTLQQGHSASLPTEYEDRWCALKLVNKETFWERVESGKERGDALIREVLAQLFLESQGHWWWSIQQPSSAATNSTDDTGSSGQNSYQPPFVRLYSIFETLNGFALELELMEAQDLFDTVAAHGVMSEEHTRHIIAQLVDAITFCQRLGMAHRDIKLSNITFPKRQPQSQQAQPSYPEVKLADFGMAGFVSSDRKLRGRCGTPGYVAPEILSAGVNEAYGINVDIFSLGVVAYTLLCGYEPFYGQEQGELLRANRLVEYAFHSPEWDSINGEAKEFIRRALEVSPDARLTPEEAKRLPWLQDLFVPVKKVHHHQQQQQTAVVVANTNSAAAVLSLSTTIPIVTTIPLKPTSTTTSMLSFALSASSNQHTTGGHTAMNATSSSGVLSGSLSGQQSQTNTPSPLPLPMSSPSPPVPSNSNSNHAHASPLPTVSPMMSPTRIYRSPRHPFSSSSAKPASVFDVEAAAKLGTPTPTSTSTTSPVSLQKQTQSPVIIAATPPPPPSTTTTASSNSCSSSKPAMAAEDTPVNICSIQ